MAAASLAALLLAGCAGATQPAATAPPSPLRPPLSQAELQMLVSNVAALRGLPEKSPIPIVRLSELDFTATLRAREHEQTPESVAKSAGFLLAFNLVPDAEQRRQTSTMSDILNEQVIGFYDPAQARVFVRASGDLTEEGIQRERSVLAHEVQHALQAQHFPAPNLDSAPDYDTRLARLAVLEGDAMVTMAMYLGAERGIPIRRVLRRASEITRSASLDGLLRSEGHSEALERALPLTRERLTFPYYAGMSFMTDMYRAGGLPLMNATFSALPASTEHILHPQKYIAGERPIHVRPPAAPPGYRVLSTERMGELQTRVVLSGCVGQPAATRAAEGWGGDAFTVLGSPDRRVALLWSTAWDTPEDAAEFEQALARSPACWRELSIGHDSDEVRVGGAYKIARNGAKVAFARGLPEPLLSQAAAHLLTLPGPPPPPVPIGPYQIPPERPIPERRPGVVAHGIYQSQWLGVAATLPENLDASTTRPELELHMERDGVPMVAAMLVSNRMATPTLNDRTLHEIGLSFAKELETERLITVSSGHVSGALGPGVERTWSIEDTPVQIRAVLVPVCEGTGSYVFVELYADSRARYALDWWLGSFRWITATPPPVCEMLNPP